MGETKTHKQLASSNDQWFGGTSIFKIFQKHSCDRHGRDMDHWGAR